MIKIISTIILISITSTVAAKDGRFRLYTFPEYINRSILLDTQTGKMWTDKCLEKDEKGDCGVSAWTENQVIGINTTYSKMAKENAPTIKSEVVP